MEMKYYDVIEKENKNESILKKIEQKMSGYLSMKDELLDDEYLEIMGDALKVVKIISQTHNLILKKKFVYFLKGFNIENEPTEDQLKKLYDYIDSEEKAEFISNNITKVLTTNSKKASFLIGLITNRLVNSNENFTYKELICINGLSNFFDFDIENIMLMQQYLEYINKKRDRTDLEWFGIYSGIKKWCTQIGIEYNESITLTVEKCVASQIIIKDIEAEIDIDDENPGDASVENSESYKFSEAGKLLLNNLKYL